MAFELAAIFDMDGVLIDSYWAHYRSWVEMADRRGLAISEQQFQISFGRTSRELMAQFWGAGRFSDEEVKAMDLEKEAAFRRIIAADFPAMPGRRSSSRPCARGVRRRRGFVGPARERGGGSRSARPWRSARRRRQRQRSPAGKADPQIFLRPPAGWACRRRDAW